MMQFFGIPLDKLTTVLLIITGIIVAIVLILALFNTLFFKIGVRNIPRRRIQMLLIVFALMLSTALLSSVLATGDIMVTTVQSVAVYNWGNIDELIEGGHGPLNMYRDGVYYRLVDQTKKNQDIAAISAALREQNLLVADQTSRQVRSKVTALALIPNSEQGFGGMTNVTTKAHMTIAALKPNQVYLNQTAALFLNAHAGDTLYLYSQRWPGKRYVMHVVAIVSNDGLVGDNPYLLSQLSTFQTIEGADDYINEIYISNRGGGGVSGIGLSDRVSDEIEQFLPHGVHVIQVKEQGVENSQKAENIFSRIFVLFCLFALAIGLLLIFLIFVLLAAERRAEMGVMRAIGVQRHHLILLFLFEGAIYDLLASFVGMLCGIGAGALLVQLLKPVMERFNFPLKLTFHLQSLVLAYCLGAIFTFCSVVISSWLVSRMTIVEAMRDLPEPSYTPYTLRGLVEQCLQMPRLFKGTSNPSQRSSLQVTIRRSRRIFFDLIPTMLLGFIQTLIRLGLLPLLAGFWCIQYGIQQAQLLPFSLGLSLLVFGGALLLKTMLEQIVSIFLRLRGSHYAMAWKRSGKWIGGIFAALVGLSLAAYWGLPFDVLANLGLPRFQGGIEVFFIAGVMMVLGASWAIMANAELLARPFLAICARLSGIYALVKLASAYPLLRRFRTGLSVVMFGLVVFAMTVMAIITYAMQNTYVDINTQTGGYDIQGTPYFKAVPDIRTSLAQHGINPQAFSAIGVRNTTVSGIIQPSASTSRWNLYPTQIVSGGFLQGYGLQLTARARGFTSDNAVWQALQSHADYALIDSSALPYNPNSTINSPVYDPNAPKAADAGSPATPPKFDPQFTFSMSGVYQGDTTFPATPIWVVGIQGKKAIKMTIIGVVDNSDNAHFGLYIPQSTYSAASVGSGPDMANTTQDSTVLDLLGTAPDSTASGLQSYYFKVAPGQDKRALALALGSAYLDNGMETTVLEDAIWQVRGPRILLSNVLLGVVGVTLLLGVAALAITGTRAVIERRQQIGMLRALGCSRVVVQGAFLLESFLVGVLGSLLGVVLGVVLAYNIFAANFFEQYQTGLYFSIPWNQLALIVGVAFLASFLGAVLPAWQAGRIAPAEALRYA